MSLNDDTLRSPGLRAMTVGEMNSSPALDAAGLRRAPFSKLTSPSPGPRARADGDALADQLASPSAESSHGEPMSPYTPVVIHAKKVPSPALIGSPCDSALQSASRPAPSPAPAASPLVAMQFGVPAAAGGFALSDSGSRGVRRVVGGNASTSRVAMSPSLRAILAAASREPVQVGDFAKSLAAADDVFANLPSLGGIAPPSTPAATAGAASFATVSTPGVAATPLAVPMNPLEMDAAAAARNGGADKFNDAHRRDQALTSATAAAASDPFDDWGSPRSLIRTVSSAASGTASPDQPTPSPLAPCGRIAVASSWAAPAPAPARKASTGDAPPPLASMLDGLDDSPAPAARPRVPSGQWKEWRAPPPPAASQLPPPPMFGYAPFAAPPSPPKPAVIARQIEAARLARLAAPGSASSSASSSAGAANPFARRASGSGGRGVAATLAARYPPHESPARGAGALGSPHGSSGYSGSRSPLAAFALRPSAAPFSTAAAAGLLPVAFSAASPPGARALGSPASSRGPPMSACQLSDGADDHAANKFSRRTLGAIVSGCYAKTGGLASPSPLGARARATPPLQRTTPLIARERDKMAVAISRMRAFALPDGAGARTRQAKGVAVTVTVIVALALGRSLLGGGGAPAQPRTAAGAAGDALVNAPHDTPSLYARFEGEMSAPRASDVDVCTEAPAAPLSRLRTARGVAPPAVLLSAALRAQLCALDGAAQVDEQRAAAAIARARCAPPAGAAALSIELRAPAARAARACALPDHPHVSRARSAAEPKAEARRPRWAPPLLEAAADALHWRAQQSDAHATRSAVSLFDAEGLPRVSAGEALAAPAAALGAAEAAYARARAVAASVSSFLSRALRALAWGLGALAALLALAIAGICVVGALTPEPPLAQPKGKATKGKQAARATAASAELTTADELALEAEEAAAAAAVSAARSTTQTPQQPLAAAGSPTASHVLRPIAVRVSMAGVGGFWGFGTSGDDEARDDAAAPTGYDDAAAHDAILSPRSPLAPAQGPPTTASVVASSPLAATVAALGALAGSPFAMAAAALRTLASPSPLGRAPAAPETPLSAPPPFRSMVDESPAAQPLSGARQALSPIWPQQPVALAVQAAAQLDASMQQRKRDSPVPLSVQFARSQGRSWVDSPFPLKSAAYSPASDSAPGDTPGSAGRAESAMPIATGPDPSALCADGIRFEAAGVLQPTKLASPPSPVSALPSEPPTSSTRAARRKSAAPRASTGGMTADADAIPRSARRAPRASVADEPGTGSRRISTRLSLRSAGQPVEFGDM